MLLARRLSSGPVEKSVVGRAGAKEVMYGLLRSVDAEAKKRMFSERRFRWIQPMLWMRDTDCVRAWQREKRKFSEGLVLGFLEASLAKRVVTVGMALESVSGGGRLKRRLNDGVGVSLLT